MELEVTSEFFFFQPENVNDLGGSQPIGLFVLNETCKFPFTCGPEKLSTEENLFPD